MKFDDEWTGPDKNKHFIGCAGIAVTLGLVSGWALAGFVAGCVVGAAVEVYDRVSGKGTSSFQDLVVSCAGSALGAIAAALVLAAV